MVKRHVWFSDLVKVMLFTSTLQAARMPDNREYTNSIGMKFVRIEPGTFQMG